MKETPAIKAPINLHLGCGERIIPGFINIDIRPLPHVDYVTSADSLNMFQDNSVDLIYASHVLEHFPRNRAEKVLAEWFRVLKPRGLLRVCVPDFERLLWVYQKEHDLKCILGPLFGGQDYPENTHYNVFDFPLLSDLLGKTGFVEIKRYNWEETVHREYDDFSQAYIPHMDKKNGVLISLNVECKKGW